MPKYIIEREIPNSEALYAAELKAISNYLAGLEGGLQIVPESRFRTSQK